MPMREGPTVRPPAAAGLFYPADPARLRAEVSELLANAAPAPAGTCTKALIVPHAGYAYSGAVAAAAFAALGEGAPPAIRRVVVIGPSHHAAFRGSPRRRRRRSLPRSDACRWTARHCRASPICASSGSPTAPCVRARPGGGTALCAAPLQAFAAVPLLVGEADPQEVAEILRRLWGGPETLIVVSSDLSHFHDHATARRLDAATAAAIERGDWAGLGPGDACGFRAIAGLLVEGGRRGLGARRLALRNSGDTAAGSRERVLGYGAWAFEEAAR